MADEDPEIDLDEEVKTEKPLEYDEEEANLVAVFAESDTKQGAAALQELAELGHSTFEEDWKSTEEYREQRAKDWTIFSGVLPKKTFPWEDCANGHVPIMLENISRLVFRAKGELIGDGQNIFGVSPVGPDDQDIAEILTRHGNWQITEDIPDFLRQIDRGLLLFFTHGDVTCFSGWDSQREQNRHEMLTSDEFVVPYVYTSTMPDYSDCPRYSRVRRYYRHELESMRGIWYGVDEVIAQEPPDWEDEPDSPMRKAQQEVDKARPPEDEPGPYKIIEWYGWATLPNQPRQHFVKMVFDHRTKRLMQLNVNEEADWKERSRFEDQSRQRKEYLAAKATYETAARQQAEVVGAAEDIAEGAGEMAQAVAPPIPESPMRPDWMDDDDSEPEPPRKTPVHMASHGVCIEPLTGNLGYGYGMIEADFNRAANTMLNQFVDAATLGNCKGIITSSTVQFNGEYNRKPGSINQVKGVTGDDLRKHVMPDDPSPANPQLFEGVKFFQEVGQSAIQSPDVLSGEPGKSGETFRGISARIEQATKQISVATRKFADFMGVVLRNNARLNAIFLPDEEIVRINDHRIGRTEELTIGRWMYERDYRVRIRADLKYTSDAARVADADAVLSGVMQIPQLAMNNRLIYELTKRAFEARDMHDLVPMLGPAPPVTGMAPPMPPGMPGQQPGANGPSGPAPTGPPQGQLQQ